MERYPFFRGNIMKLFKKMLAGILSATLLISSSSIGVMADEIIYDEFYNEIYAETEESASESFTDFENTSTEIETESATETITYTETEEETSTSDDSLDADNPDIIDDNDLPIEIVYGVEDAYASEYSVEDIKNYFESEGDITLQDSDLYVKSEEFKAVDWSKQVKFYDENKIAEYLRNQMRDRTYKCVFVSTKKLNDKEILAKAYGEEMAGDSRDGGYIRANLIGHGFGIQDNSANGTYNYICKFKYTSTKEQENTVDSKVQSIVSQLGLKNYGKSDLEKIKAINDYLIDNITYKDDHTDAAHGVYSALILGRCVCQGYSGAFYRLCREAGIDCEFIVGSKIGHAWNIVKLSDLEGKPVWYNMDVTYNDGSSTGLLRYTYFLKNDIDFIGHPRNEEFLTDEYISKHPMAYKSYESEGRLLNLDNPENIFKDLSGNEFSSIVDDENRKPKLLVFYGTTDVRSQESMTYIAKSRAVTSGCVDVYAIEIRGASNSEIAAFKKKYAGDADIEFVSGRDTKNFDIANNYMKYIERRSAVSLTPAVVMIDDSNVLQIVSEGYITDFDIDRICMPELRSEWNPEAPILESISLNYKSLKLGKSKTITGGARLVVMYNPVDCITPKYVKFTSSDESVAKVDKDGLVMAVSAGEAVITANCSGRKAEVPVTVVNYADSISITDASGVIVDNGTLNIPSGEETILNLKTHPDNACIRGKIEWKVSNPSLLNITVSEDGYSVSVTGSPDITKREQVTLHAEADGFNAKCDIVIEPSMLKLNANGGTINGNTYSYFRINEGQPLGDIPSPDARKGYAFVGWSTSADARTGVYVSEKTVFNGQWNLYAIWRTAEPEKMWVRELGSQTYTGKLIKPSVKVYDGDLLLKEGVDYTVAYRNNVNAYTYVQGDDKFDAAKAPCAIIKGKNNYESTYYAYFTINQKNITDLDVIINSASICKTETGKQILPIPEIKWGTVALRNKTDFTLEYPDSSKAGAYTKPGNYTIVVKGSGNYCGTKNVTMQLYSKNRISITKATVRNLKNYEYNGSDIVQGSDFALYYGGNRLSEGTDYSLVYSANRQVGVATITVTGIGAYSGERKINFRITGRDISKAVISKESLAQVSYTGHAIEPYVELTYRIDKNNVCIPKKSTDGGVTGDYIVTYSENVNAGYGKITIRGINGYTGTLVKAFRIIPYKIENTDDSRFEVTYNNEVAYEKSGAKPAVSVKFESRRSGGTKDWICLTEGKDYVVKYVNTTQTYNLSPGDQGFFDKRGNTTAPTIQIVGKGNYSGKLLKYYKIVPGSLNEQAYIVAPDVTYSSKAGKVYSKITVLDNAGKRLAAGTDYASYVEYRYAADAVMTDGSRRSKDALVEKTDAPMPGTTINVIVTGMGKFSSSDSSKLKTVTPYKVLADNKDIGKGITFTVRDKYYTGSGMNPETGIVITKDDITFKTDRNHTGFTANDYEIVPGSYKQNKLIGFATVTLRGTNSYGGTKEVRFRIRKKSIF